MSETISTLQTLISDVLADLLKEETEASATEAVDPTQETKQEEALPEAADVESTEPATQASDDDSEQSLTSPNPQPFAEAALAKPAPGKVIKPTLLQFLEDVQRVGKAGCDQILLRELTRMAAEEEAFTQVNDFLFQKLLYDLILSAGYTKLVNSMPIEAEDTEDAAESARSEQIRNYEKLIEASREQVNRASQLVKELEELEALVPSLQGKYKNFQIQAQQALDGRDVLTRPWQSPAMLLVYAVALGGLGASATTGEWIFAVIAVAFAFALGLAVQQDAKSRSLTVMTDFRACRDRLNKTIERLQAVEEALVEFT